MPDWAREELGCVADLLPVFGDEAKTTAFLARVGVRVVDGVFARRALLRALDPGGDQRVPQGSGELGEPGQDSDEADVRVLRRALVSFGLEIVGVRRGKTTSFGLVASGPPRRVTSVIGGEDLVIQSRGKGEPVSARLYSTDRRHGAAAQYTASGLDDRDPTRQPALFFFVLASPAEPRVWLARREELVEINADLRATAKGQRGRRRYGRSGFAPIMKQPSYMRVWMPESVNTDLDPGNRIADENNMLIARPA